MGITRIRGNHIKDESVESKDIASGSIKAGELSGEAIIGQATITTTDYTNDRLLMWDATDSDLKQIAPGILLTPNSPFTIDASEPSIQFKESGADRAEIHINVEDNLLLTNQSTNKFIIFKTNDAGTVREGLRIGGTVPEVVVNEGSDSLIDFRVESDNQPHMLFVDGSQDRIGIGTRAPEAMLHIHAGATHTGIVRISQVDNSDDASQLDLFKARDFLGNGLPSVIGSSDFIGQIRFSAYNGSAYEAFADIYAQATGQASSTSHPTKLVFRTTNAGSTTPSTALILEETQNARFGDNISVEDAIVIRNSNPPSSASSTGLQGEIRYDSNYLYVCVATDTWKRILLSSW